MRCDTNTKIHEGLPGEIYIEIWPKAGDELYLYI
jgi:hypothetical protein